MTTKLPSLKEIKDRNVWSNKRVALMHHMLSKGMDYDQALEIVDNTYGKREDLW